MNHVLDNPLYNALLSGNKHFASGTDDVKYFPKEVSPFAGTRDFNPTLITALYDLLPNGRVVVFITAQQSDSLSPWEVVHQSAVYQMMGDQVAVSDNSHNEIVPLTVADVPQMLSLTKLTNPGPFEERTIEFGDYFGIFNDGQLVAMAGQRLHVGDYMEVSAVCTHPDHLGKGYARALILHTIKQIVALGKTPFLHVRTDNTRAIEVYKSMGFTIRQQLCVNVLLKK
ncbi:GNAT family N-acetyltransferase [Mucilaginibacter jinjuensis]|uniref:GNAT family N-acetyltransferase n=1 Tax=Mucilaginibacter jinjuensis TaxID=1176721 RepID=A0ABY7TAI9_9SPHI|nr:GNAT family N-acetyltransferase [Mucilaginibacter jinjuensis]WCT13105.1 GNAT family N-acetyltransferase [Mucilaginibacter jinjuensis]